MLLESVRSHMITLPEIEVVGEAADGEVAVMGILRTDPDYVLLDLELPVKDGFEVMEAVRLEQPGIKFLILSGHCSMYTVHQVKRAGVAGFIDKSDCGLAILRMALCREIVARCRRNVLRLAVPAAFSLPFWGQAWPVRGRAGWA